MSETFHDKHFKDRAKFTKTQTKLISELQYIYTTDLQLMRDSSMYTNL